MPVLVDPDPGMLSDQEERVPRASRLGVELRRVFGMLVRFEGVSPPRAAGDELLYVLGESMFGDSFMSSSSRAAQLHDLQTGIISAMLIACRARH